MSSSSLIRFGVIAAAAALGVAGCASREKEPPVAVNGRATPTVADRHVISLEQEDRTLSIPVTGDATPLDNALSQDLAEFARAYLQLGQGPLRAQVPAEGPAGEAALARFATVAEELRANGVGPGEIARSNAADPQGVLPIVLSFSQTVAVAPECAPLWEQNLAFAPSNLPWKSFGCANKANLAALVADARDLDRPRDETPADAHRRQVVLDKYREGEVTHASRSQSERVAISTTAE